RHTRFSRDWSSDVCSSDLEATVLRRIAEGLGISNFAFEQILGMIQAQNSFGGGQHQYTGGGSQAPRPDQLALAYKALGVSASASDRKSTRLNSSHVKISYA